MYQTTYITKDLFNTLKTLNTSMLNEQGLEVNNPKPININVGIKRPPTLQEQIQRVLRTELSIQASAQGHETFDEANDFDILDDFEVNEPNSPYNLVEEEYLQPPENSTEASEGEPNIPPPAGDNKTPEANTELSE